MHSSGLGGTAYMWCNYTHTHKTVIYIKINLFVKVEKKQTRKMLNPMYSICYRNFVITNFIILLFIINKYISIDYTHVPGLC